nr:MAG TPA: hypothetical protein [Caudoviricetes sp.]
MEQQKKLFLLSLLVLLHHLYRIISHSPLAAIVKMIQAEVL